VQQKEKKVSAEMPGHARTGTQFAGVGADPNRLPWHHPQVGDVIAPPAGRGPGLFAFVKRTRQRKRKRRNVADLRKRRDDGIATLKIVAYDLRAETFARRYCGLTGKEIPMEKIAQAISDFVGKHGA
jgi:hypothetical protein